MPTLTLYGDRSKTVEQTATSLYNFFYDGRSQLPYSYNEITIDFVYPKDATELSERYVVSYENYFYITGKSYAMSPPPPTPPGNWQPGEYRYMYFAYATPYFESTSYADYVNNLANPGGYVQLFDRTKYDFGTMKLSVCAKHTQNSGAWTKTQYVGNVSMSAYTSHPTYPPRTDVVYGEFTPETSGMTPSGGYVNKKTENMFRYGANYKAYETYSFIVGYPEIKTADIEYKSENGTVVAVTGGKDGVVFPAGTFGSGKYYWRCRITSSRDVVGAWSNWVEFTTVDATPTSTPLSPKDNFISNYTDNTFFWKHDTAYGSPQYAYDLQYWQNENIGNWVNLKTHEVTGNTSLLVPKDTFATGTLTWRVRTYNMDDVAGEWSLSALVNVMGRPNAPAISAIDSSPRPTIYWSSAGQEAYQLLITKGGVQIHDSKPIYGYAKLAKTPFLLDDGTYVYSLRIKNKYNIWSEYAAATTQVKNGSALRFSLRGESVQDYAGLNWSGVPDALDYLVYCNKTPIAKTNALYYTDLYAIGENEYSVRALLAGDNYALSDTVRVKSTVNRPVLRRHGADIAQADKLDLIMRRGEKPSHERTDALISQAQFYTGRRLPVVQVSQFAQSDHSFSYTLKSQKELEKLLSMRGTPVAYKSRQGVVIGVITTVSATNHYDGMPDVSFTIAQIDSKLDVQYD